jgi:hypothetical protein
MSQQNQTYRPAPSSVLWASAFVIAAMILVVAGRGGGLEARGEMVSRVGEYTLLSTDGGNEDVIVVLDSRSEELMVYKIVRQRSVDLMQKINLKETFSDARRQVVGGR